jgi:hypothetical protein
MNTSSSSAYDFKYKKRNGPIKAQAESPIWIKIWDKCGLK